ncbi:MAG: PilW family protein [Pseudomonadota bacterium]
MISKRQLGFSLIELMIAMVIGLVLLLAATEAFRSIKISFNRLQDISNLQSSLSFVSDTLLHDIRRAELIDENDGVFTIRFMNDDQHLYRVTEDDGDYMLQVDSGDGFAALATGLVNDQPLLERYGDEELGGWQVNLSYRDGGDVKDYSFLAIHRREVFQ